MDRYLSLRYRLENIGRTAFMAAIAGTCLGLFSSVLDNIHPIGPILRGLLLGLFIGANIGFFEEIVYHNTFRKKTLPLFIVDENSFIFLNAAILAGHY
jgi:hypothetical protein